MTAATKRWKKRNDEEERKITQHKQLKEKETYKNTHLLRDRQFCFTLIFVKFFVFFKFSNSQSICLHFAIGVFSVNKSVYRIFIYCLFESDFIGAIIPD